jgi:predicted transcriptional regulator
MTKIDNKVMLEMIEAGKTQTEVAKYFGVSCAAVCKKLKRFTPLPESLEKLTDKERKFAIAISEGKTKTQAALASYECGSMESAKTLGKRMAVKPDIQTAVAEIMQNEGLTRTDRVRKLKEHVYNRDPNVSLKALDQSWKLDGAYVERHEVNVGINNMAEYLDAEASEAELDKKLAHLEADMGDVVVGEIEEN